MSNDRIDALIDYFAIYQAESEAVFDVPATVVDHPPLTISIVALGGATVAKGYADNTWIYAVHAGGVVVASGADLRSGGIPRTHLQMAAVVGFCLAAAPVAFTAGGEPPPFDLHQLAERLSLWAHGIDEGNADE